MRFIHYSIITAAALAIVASALPACSVDDDVIYTDKLRGPLEPTPKVFFRATATPNYWLIREDAPETSPYDYALYRLSDHTKLLTDLPGYALNIAVDHEHQRAYVCTRAEDDELRGELLQIDLKTEQILWRVDYSVGQVNPLPHWLLKTGCDITLSPDQTYISIKRGDKQWIYNDRGQARHPRADGAPARIHIFLRDSPRMIRHDRETLEIIDLEQMTSTPLPYRDTDTLRLSPDEQTLYNEQLEAIMPDLPQLGVRQLDSTQQLRLLEVVPETGLLLSYVNRKHIVDNERRQLDGSPIVIQEGGNYLVTMNPKTRVMHDLPVHRLINRTLFGFNGGRHYFAHSKFGTREPYFNSSRDDAFEDQDAIYILNTRTLELNWLNLGPGSWSNVIAFDDEPTLYLTTLERKTDVIDEQGVFYASVTTSRLMRINAEDNTAEELPTGIKGQLHTILRGEAPNTLYLHYGERELCTYDLSSQSCVEHRTL